MPVQVIAYVPVIHRGYLQFFRDQPQEVVINILHQELTQDYEPLQKDIRSLTPEQILQSLQALLPDRTVQVLTKDQLHELNHPDQQLLLPNEDISHQVAEAHLTQAQVSYHSVFLRWDKLTTTAKLQPTPTATISQTEAAQTFLRQAHDSSQQSADWWRQVGAVLVQNGQVIGEALNHHLPNQQQPYIVGDPRANFHKGEQIELSTAMHAEASLIAQAAKEGTTVNGAQLYVTTFPCPVCAKLVAESGIKELYYSDGYAMLDGEDILKNKGVSIFRVTQ